MPDAEAGVPPDTDGGVPVTEGAAGDRMNWIIMARGSAPDTLEARKFIRESYAATAEDLAGCWEDNNPDPLGLGAGMVGIVLTDQVMRCDPVPAPRAPGEGRTKGK